MPWKDHYTTSDEIGIRDAYIQWPNGVQMPLGVTVNLNPAGTAKGITAKDLAYPTWHFALNEGLDQFLTLFADLGIRATFATPALVADAYPDVVDRVLAGGHEIAAQGLIGEDPAIHTDGGEGAAIERATEILSAATGRAPQGVVRLVPSR